MIQGVSHYTFIVQDMRKTAQFLKTVFEAQEVYDSAGNPHAISEEKYLMIGDTWLVLMEGRNSLPKSYNHLSFQIAAEDYDLYWERVQSLGLEIRPARKRHADEAQSLYFYDYDNHLFELHTGSLAERLASYRLAESDLGKEERLVSFPLER